MATPAALARRLGLENLRDAVGGSLAAVIAEVEALGGTVTSISGGGLQAMFGSPEAHEDDPERAMRAAFRSLLAVPAHPGDQAPTLRIGVETGQVLLGPLEQSLALAEQIAELDAKATYHVTAGVAPHKWVYLWPLIAAHLDTGHTAEAVAAARHLFIRPSSGSPMISSRP